MLFVLITLTVVLLQTLTFEEEVIFLFLTVSFNTNLIWFQTFSIDSIIRQYENN